MAMGFVLNLYSARLLGVDGYGILSYGLSLLSVFAIAIGLGADQLAVKWIAPRVASGNFDEILPFYKKTVLLLLLTSGVCAVLALGYFFIDGYLGRGVLFALLASPLVALMMLNESVIRGLGHVLLSTVASQLIRPTATITLLVCLLLLGEPTQIIVFTLYVLGIFLAFVFTHFYANKKLMLLQPGKRYQEGVRMTSFAELLSLTKGFYAVVLIGVLLNKIDIIMLGVMLEDYEVGLYAAAYSLAFLVLVVLQVINLVIAPEIAAAHANSDETKVKKLLFRSCWIGGGMALPLFIGLFFFPSFLLSFFGDQFVEGKIALQLLATGMLINALFGSVGSYLMMSGHERLFAWIMLLATFLSVVLLIFLIPIYGINGAAFVVSLTMLLWNSAAFYWSRKIIASYGTS